MRKLYLALLWVLLGATAALAQPASYRLDKILGTPVDNPRDVAVDGQGNIYLADGAVTKLDSTGRFLAQLAPSSTLGSAEEIAVDAAGNLYLAAYRANAGEVIRKYGPGGQLLRQFGSFGTPGSTPADIQGISGLAVDAAGLVYLIEGLPRVLRFDAQGNALAPLPVTTPSGSTEMKDLALDAATGTLYLLYDNYVVLKLSLSGQVLGQVTLGGMSGGGSTGYWAETIMLEANGNLLVAGSQSNIARFSPTGARLGGVARNFTSSTHTAMAPGRRRGQLYVTDFTHQVNSNHLYYFEGDSLRRRWGNIPQLTHVRQDAAGNVYTYDGLTVRKYDAAGQLVRSFLAYANQEVAGFAVDVLGYVYVLNTGSQQVIELLKYDPQGTRVARLTPANSALNGRASGLAVGPQGQLYVSEYYGHRVLVLDALGVQQAVIGGSMGLGAGQLFVPRAVAADVRGNVYVADNDGRRVQQFSSTGQLLQQYGVPATFMQSAVGFVDMEVDGRGNVYVGSFMGNASKVYAADGSSSTALPIGCTAVSVSRTGDRLLCLSRGTDAVRCYVPTQQLPTNLLGGLLYYDANGNCRPDAGEPGLPSVAVVAQPGDYYGLTDATGHYVLAVDSGTYQVHSLPPPPTPGLSILGSCGPSAPVRVRGYNNVVGSLDLGHQATLAPYLRVTVASDRRRRCFRNTTTLTYSNGGYAPATGVVVTLALPPQVVLVKADRAYVRTAAGTYAFAVGTVGAGQSGSIVVLDSVACTTPTTTGLTVCTKAWITPANIYPPANAWNQASVALRGQVQAGNQVRFVLRNAGARPMTDSLNLRLFQNTDLALTHRYWLAAGDSLVLRVPATRPVVRLEADQPAGHPTQRTASATVEVPALGTAGQPNPAMLAQPPSAPAPDVAEDCQPIRDSYDPNDKLVVPTGVTSQHYTPTGVPLHYRIRFQNTGNDDAYRVVVVDTLAAGLDLRTLRPEGSSHPYRLSVTGHGRPVLTFVFDNINLPPSARNEPASNGFVQFSIQPQAGLPAKTLIENYADIFFDYNAPVRTPPTVNRLYDVPETVVPAVALAYPAVVASPTLAGLTPAQGRIGTLVTLAGQRLAPGGAAPQVRFNGTPTPVLSATATALTVRVPAGSSTGLVQVLTADGGARSAQPFTVFQPPVVAAVAPAEGVVGTVVTITGSNFSAVAAQDTVWLGGVAVPVQQASATSLQVVVPAGAATSPVRVAALGGQASSAQPFTVWLPPTVAGFSPAQGKAGDVVTLTGSHFAPAARNEVGFGPAAGQVVQASAGSLQVRVPAGAQSGPLRLQTPGGTVLTTNSFTFWPAPTLLSFAPAAASVGEVVTLTGRNFLVAGRPDTVYFGGQPAAVLAASATAATVRVPRGATTGPLVVGGTGGRASSAAPFTVLDLTPAEALALYPAPAHGSVTLDWQRADFAVERARLCNAVGAVLYEADLSRQPGTSLTVPLASVAPGFYVLVVQTARGPVQKQLVVY